MHPGPMNRGIEIDTILADDINKSVIKNPINKIATLINLFLFR